jgi:hypothetical protein
MWSAVTSQSEMVLLQGKICALDDTNGTEDLIAIDIVDEYDNEPRVSRIERFIEGISLSWQEPFICVSWQEPFIGQEPLIVCTGQQQGRQSRSGAEGRPDA